jgi:hypothetical protein
MNPRLELALCEALEEELTRELALVIEPIMIKIKGCIPAIIESCRQKLNSTASSSDDKALFIPSATSPETSGSRSSVKAAREWVDSTPSRCGAPPATEAHAIESQIEILQPPMCYTGVFNTMNLQYTSSTEHSSDPGTCMLASDAHHPCHGSRDTSIDNPSDQSLDLKNIPGPYTYSGTFPSGSIFTAGSKSAAIQGLQEPILNPYRFGEWSPPQDQVSLSDFPNSAGPLADGGWDQMHTRQENASAEWLDVDLFPHLLTPGEWDSLIDDPNI